MFESIIMDEEEMLQLKRPIIDACIKSAQKNGWSDAMGLLRGTLFLESKPMSLDMMAEKTGYSKTTIRSNMNYLENLGIVRRVVGPLGKPHRYKQHRYSLVTDAESMRPVILAAVKDEVHLVLQALVQIKKSFEDRGIKDAELEAQLAKSIQFYEETNRILNLISQFSSKELIEILESKKKSDSSKQE